MPIIRKKRLPDGSFGPLESVTGLPNVNQELVIAFEAIAMQQSQIEELKQEVESLKGESKE
jgi:hypothetical protein